MIRFRPSLIAAILLVATIATGSRFSTTAQRQSSAAKPSTADDSISEMRPIIEYYVVDRGSLQRSYPVASSPARRERFRKFYGDALERIRQLNFDAMSQAGKVDYVLFRNHLERELRQLDIEEKQLADLGPLAPFAPAIVSLEEARRRMEPIDSAKTAAILNDVKKQIEETRRAVEAGLRPERGAETRSETVAPIRVKKTVAFRAVGALTNLRNNLRNWYTFYNGYDPIFTWWNEQPYRALDDTLAGYVSFLSERVVGLRAEGSSAETTSGRGTGGGGVQGRAQAQPSRVQVTPRAGDTSDIVGDPIGRDALISELQFEMVPYTPEELIAFAEKEMAWCENEMKKASRELGYGDDWKKALDHVKNLYVEPGKQPQMIRDLALEAIKYMEDNDLITVPQLAKDTWRMEMMTPERQLVSPFFLGGEVIQVSYPTNTMSHEQKMMSMRGNNPHFSRATVHHELIPGHHLQGFMTARYKPYRGLFSTPFWGEGWALYWELLLWDMNFAKNPENKIGMLFWHMHRCARIVFSLSFHLEKMTPQECIDYLVNRVGHERDNATAEVRRSFDGSYGPLYQIAYLLGGRQFYALHRELVDSKKMKDRAFHDWILQENRIPVEMVRAILTNQKLTRDFKTSWRFLPN
jgi:uncharacterized protein (DUF885 family)